MNPNDAIKQLSQTLEGLKTGLGSSLDGLAKGLIKKEVKIPIQGKISKVTIGYDNSVIVVIPEATQAELDSLIKKLSD